MPVIGLAVVVTGPIFGSVYDGAYEGIGTLATWGVFAFLLFLPGLILVQSLIAHGHTRYMVYLMVLQATLLLISTGIAIWQDSTVVFVALTAITQVSIAAINVILVPRVIGWHGQTFSRSVVSGILYAIPAIATFSVLRAFEVGLLLEVGFASVVLGAMITVYLLSQRGREIRRLITS